MGRYLCCGIAKNMIIRKGGHQTEKILEELGKTIDLSIYEEPIDHMGYMFLGMKKEIMEKNIVKFIEEQLDIAMRNTKYEESEKTFLKELKDKKYDELMEIAETKKYERFQLIEGSEYRNDISYISDDLTIYAGIVIYLIEGKVFFECYYELFRYLRNLIVNNSSNPIRTAAVVSIIGW